MSDLIPSPKANHRLQFFLFAFILLVVVFVLLILSGFFDPQPLGQETIHLEPGPAGIPANSATTTWLDLPALTSPYTVQLIGGHESGEQDIGYGLAVGSPAEHLVVAVSPLGYVSIWAVSSKETTNHLPWQPWPHVRSGAAENEIWLDYDGQQVTVRLNRELLWSGPVSGLGGQVGLYGESFGEPAGVDYTSLTIFN